MRVRDIHSQSSCPPISCGVSDFRGADFVFWVQPDGSSGRPVPGSSVTAPLWLTCPPFVPQS
ncbi:hypothetical protein BV911_18260 [Pseudoruegeria sp. SK021]|nr:hypothetical protein BV911_18260 [Pseudoruegeria sp. SK021]